MDTVQGSWKSHSPLLGVGLWQSLKMQLHPKSILNYFEWFVYLPVTVVD